jgi:hypothetical protein
MTASASQRYQFFDQHPEISDFRADFIKALTLGADAIAVSNSAIQAIGCLGMRACGHDPINGFSIDHLETRNGTPYGYCLRWCFARLRINGGYGWT